jgi:hypothetical protein
MIPGLILPLRALVLLLLALRTSVLLAADFDHGHPAFAKILAAHVTNGVVDYASLKAAPSELRSYLTALSEVPRGEFDKWSREQRLAFLINLYNAATLQLIVDHYPVPSIRKIGSLLKGPWKQEVVGFQGGRITLDRLEHELIRPVFSEPRIHFALVCAARSCPPLRSEPFVAGRLGAQLDDQARVFLAQSDKNRIDRAAKTLWLSPIFDWYGSDFTQDGRSIVDYVADHLPASDASDLKRGGFRVRHTEYDWTLNDRPR